MATCKDGFLSHLIDQYINPALFNILTYAISLTHSRILSAKTVHTTEFFLFAGGNLMSERDSENTAKFLCAAFWYSYE